MAGPEEVELDRLMMDEAPAAPVERSEGTFFKRRNSDVIWEINIGYACFDIVDTYINSMRKKYRHPFRTFSRDE